MSQGLQAECQTGKYYMQLMQENYELKCRNKYLQGQLEKARRDIISNVVNAIQWIDGEPVIYEELLKVLACPITDGNRLDIYMIPNEEDDRIFLKGHIDEKGVIYGEDGRAIDPKNMCMVVSKTQYNKLIKRAEYEMEAFPDASEAVSKAIAQMSSAGIPVKTIQQELQQYLDKNDTFIRGIHTISVIPPGLIKPREKELEARDLPYERLIDDYKEITNPVWGINKTADQDITQCRERKTRGNKEKGQKEPKKLKEKDKGLTV